MKDKNKQAKKTWGPLESLAGLGLLIQSATLALLSYQVTRLISKGKKNK